VAWLHGLGASSTLGFASTVRHPALAATTSLLIDLPGHGQSAGPTDWTYAIEDQATVVIDALTALTDHPVTLLGHSMGGVVALAGAKRAPGAVERLILAEPALDPGRGPLSAHIAAQREEWFVQRGYAALVRVTERQAARGDAAARSFLPSLRLASPIAMHRSATSLVAHRSPAFRHMLAELAMPVALITGANAPPFEPPLEVAGLQGYVVRDAGHVPQADNPGGFAEVVAAALGAQAGDGGD